MSEIGNAMAMARAASALAVVLPAIFAYWGVGGYGYVALDDHQYVASNPAVLGGLTRDGVYWAFTAFHSNNWHPLTWLSHMLDVELFGPGPHWPHRVNVLLHLACVESLFFLLWRTTGRPWRAAFVAAVFGAHPLHVESVAWISERKDVLSTLFMLWAMIAHARYVERPSAGRYAATAACFTLALLSKQMAVTLPVVLLLMDFWPLRRAWSPRLVLEKVPLAIIAGAVGIMTWGAQQVQAIVSWKTLPPWARLANAFRSYAVYLADAFVPSGLAFYYPHPGTGISMPGAVAAALLLAVLTGLALRQARERRWLAVGWFWFLATLLPVIGLVQVGSQARADRYMYFPLVGIALCVAWGAGEAASARKLPGWVLPAAATCAVLALAAGARVQAGYWRDTGTLCRRALAVTEGNWLAHELLGGVALESGKPDEAIGHFREAIRIRPRLPGGHERLGEALAAAGRETEAGEAFRRERELYPP